MGTADLNVLRVINEIAPPRATADAKTVARAVHRHRDDSSPADLGEPPWYGIEEPVRTLEAEGLVATHLVNMPVHPDDSVPGPERVAVSVTDAGREALEDQHG